jgi:hypothetical protein
MKILKYLVIFFGLIGFGVVVLLVLAAVLQAQTSSNIAERTITAHIPYDFWVEGALLPAGDYTLSSVEETVMIFRNEKANAEQQAFLLPRRNSSVGEHKLVFVVRDGRHYLREIWKRDRMYVITSESYWPVGPGDTETQVPLIVHTPRTSRGTAKPAKASPSFLGAPAATNSSR